MTGSNDPASTFLHNVLPWMPGHYINVEAFDWVPDPGGPLGKGSLAPKASRACRDLAEALNFIRWQDGLGREVYIRMAAHRQAGIAKRDKLGRDYFLALGGKTNAAYQKSLFIDVDVKEGAHQTTQEAIQVVLAMCAALGLPLPSIVVYSGGGGFHAHWVLDQAIPTADWLALANALKEACKAHGIHADHNLTINPVCLLRIPGTHNRKYGTPRMVVTAPTLRPALTAAKAEEVLGPYIRRGNPSSSVESFGTNITIDPLVFPSGTPVVLDARFTAGIPLATLTLEEIAAGCPLIKDTLDSHGAGQKEPLWFAVGQVTPFTTDGRKDLHRLSDGHTGYDSATTDERYDRYLTTKIEGDHGWPRCQTMADGGATQCAGCVNFPAGKSPLNFAVRARTTTPPVTPPGNSPQPPVEIEHKIEQVEGYTVDPAAGIYSYEIVDSKGNTRIVPVWRNPMWNLKYHEDYMGRFAVHFDTMKTEDVPVQVVLPTASMIDTHSLRRCLVEKYGLGLHPKEQGGLLGFMADFKTQLQRTRDSIHKQELMGWSEEAGKVSAFIYGPTKFNCTGNTRFNQTDPMIKEMYFPTGSADAWKTAIKMLNAEQRPEMDLLVATAFGAPLMKFAGEKGVVINAWSTGSSHHKTTAIKVGQAVWGSQTGINQLTDTLGSVIERIGLIRVMPSYFDEMKSADRIKQFAQMIYQFSGGRGKGRLNRNAELKDIKTWETLLVGVSNESLVDMVARHDKTTEAGVNRIFEFEVAPPNPQHGQISVGDAGTILKNLETNYGHAGLEYAAYLGRSVDILPKMVHDMTNYLEKILKAGNDERYWLSAAAVLLCGAQIANNLNLTRFDVNRMSDFVATTFGKMRLTRLRSGVNLSDSDNLLTILSAFINSDRRGLIATDTVGQSGRAGAMNPVKVFNIDDVRLSTELKIRYIEDVRKLRLSKRALVTWLTKQEIAPGVVINRIMERYGATEIRTSIGTGTDRKGAQEKVIELDLNHPELTGLYSRHV